MGRIADILVRVRDSLSDPDADRWSDARLLRLIDEAQKDIATKAKLLRTTATIQLLPDTHTYDLPSEAINIVRITDLDGNQIPMRSHAQMDDIDPTWEFDIGSSLEYIVFDKLNPGQFKVHPIPEVGDVADVYITGTYGVVVAIEDDTIGSPYGIVADINQSVTRLAEFNSVYGELSDMSEVIKSLLVYYHERPTEIDAIDLGTSVLEIDEMYDKAIKHYVIGMAWRDDQDTQNRKLASEELQFYAMEFVSAKKHSAADNISSSKQETNYYSGFE